MASCIVHCFSFKVFDNPFVLVFSEGDLKFLPWLSD